MARSDDKCKIHIFFIFITWAKPYCIDRNRSRNRDPVNVGYSNAGGLNAFANLGIVPTQVAHCATADCATPPSSHNHALGFESICLGTQRFANKTWANTCLIVVRVLCYWLLFETCPGIVTSIGSRLA